MITRGDAIAIWHRHVGVLVPNHMDEILDHMVELSKHHNYSSAVLAGATKTWLNFETDFLEGANRVVVLNSWKKDPITRKV